MIAKENLVTLASLKTTYEIASKKGSSTIHLPKPSSSLSRKAKLGDFGKRWLDPL